MNGIERFSEDKLFLEAIVSNDHEKFIEFIQNGINIYQVRCTEYFCDGKIYKQIETPFLISLKFGNEDISDYLLDIYERDLEVLKGTRYEKAYVAMPDFQTEEFLKCCELSIPKNDEKFVEPVLLKKNNMEQPKLGFLSRKNREALKFIHKLEKIGSCDLNFEFPHPEIFYHKNYLQESLNIGNDLRIAKRLLENSFVSQEMKSSMLKTFQNRVIREEKIEDFSDYFKNYQFTLSDLQICISDGNPENFIPISTSIMKQRNCTFKELLKMDLKAPDDSHKRLVVHEIFESLSRSEVFWSLTFDDDDLMLENAFGDTCVNLLLGNPNFDVEILKDFIERHLKLLEIKSKNNLSILHYAVINGDVELIEMIFQICSNNSIFMEDEDATVDCLSQAYELFKNKPEVIMEVLKLLIPDDLEEFLIKNATKILFNSILKFRAEKKVVEFFLNLPFKLDLNQMFDGQSIYMTIQDSIFSKRAFEMILNYQDVGDWNVEGNSHQTLFMKVCELLGDKPNFIKSILEKQPNCATYISSNGSTCLHNFKRMTKETLEILLNAGANPKVVNDAGEKVIVKAIGKPEVFSVLLGLESDKDLKIKYGENGDTLLHLISDPKVAKFILTRNVDLTATNNKGQTPLHVYTSSDLKKLYIDHIIAQNISFDFNLLDNDGYSVLMYSIKHIEYKTFEKIIVNFKNEIDFDVCNKNGDNFAKMIMELFEEWFQNFFKIVKKEILEIFLSKIPFEKEYPTDNLLEVIEYLRLDSMKKNFQHFVNNEKVLKVIFRKYPNFMELFDDKMPNFLKAVKNCENAVAFEMILSKMSGSELFNVNIDGENILHMICEKNNQEMINSVLDTLTTEEFKTLSRQIFNKKLPFELLNEENQNIFEEYLKHE